jgi:hypothetical protein
METEKLSSIISYLNISYKENILFTNLPGSQNMVSEFNKQKEFYLRNLLEIAQLSPNYLIARAKCLRELNNPLNSDGLPNLSNINTNLVHLDNISIMLLETLLESPNFSERVIFIIDSLLPDIKLSEHCLRSLLKLYGNRDISPLAKGIILKILSYENHVKSITEGSIDLFGSFEDSGLSKYLISVFCFQISRFLFNCGQLREEVIISLSKSLLESGESLLTLNILKTIENYLRIKLIQKQILNNVFEYFKLSKNGKLTNICYSILSLYSDRAELPNNILDYLKSLIQEGNFDFNEFSLKLFNKLIPQVANINKQTLSDLNTFFLNSIESLSHNCLSIYLNLVKKGYGIPDKAVAKISQLVKTTKCKLMYLTGIAILKSLVESCYPLKLDSEKTLKYIIRNKNEDYEVAKSILEMNNKLIPWYKK